MEFLGILRHEIKKNDPLAEFSQAVRHLFHSLGQLWHQPQLSIVKNRSGKPSKGWNGNYRTIRHQRTDGRRPPIPLRDRFSERDGKVICRSRPGKRLNAYVRVAA
jgi:hypothetical protein